MMRFDEIRGFGQHPIEGSQAGLFADTTGLIAIAQIGGVLKQRSIHRAGVFRCAGIGIVDFKLLKAWAGSDSGVLIHHIKMTSYCSW
jgi:hypothetical protein